MGTMFYTYYIYMELIYNVGLKKLDVLFASNVFIAFAFIIQDKDIRSKTCTVQKC